MNKENKFIEDSLVRSEDKDKPFEPLNFWMMGGCVVLIILGFLFMTGGGSSIEGGFNPDIFSTRRIIVGPLLCFLGFLLMAFAIVWKPRRHKINQVSESPEKPLQ